jgi:competence protein ComEA
VEQSTTPWRVFDAPPNGTGERAEEPATGRDGQHARAASPPTTKLAIAGVAGAVVIGAVAVVVALSAAGGQIVHAPDRTTEGPNAQGMLTAAEIVVEVTGAVTKPGVYRLPAGSRVGDAIDAAGGFSPRVDAGRVAAALNLAAALTDGSQVHVPSRDDPTATAATGTEGGSGGGGGGGGGGGSVNLNTATQAELEALPGIGPVTAAKIIESRAATPFTSVEQLRERKLVGEKTFDQLKSLVTVD